MATADSPNCLGLVIPTNPAARRSRGGALKARSSQRGHRKLIAQINADAAEKNRGVGAGGGFVQEERQIERHHEGMVTAVAQAANEGVVAQTTAAIEVARAGSELNDVHQGLALALVGDEVTSRGRVLVGDKMTSRGPVLVGDEVTSRVFVC